MKKKAGLIVNPIAGMGGKVGLKGTDGARILERAIRIGALPEAPRRAAQALERLAGLEGDLHFLTYHGEMGEGVLLPSGFEMTVLGAITPGRTTAEDTERAAREMRAAGVDLLLFVGGDGTARNVCNAIGDRLPALGVPAGVKMHSAVFGTTPRNAGELARIFLQGRAAGTREAEVMDIDEDAFRDERVSARLYGYLRVPFERRLVQSVKAGRTGDEDAAARAIALEVAGTMAPDCAYIIGPGTTTREIMRVLDLPNTLLGVDVVLNRSLLAGDANEGRLLEILEATPAARIVVSVIGGQGYLFGRGNQQISDRVIERVGRDNIIVVATRAKLFALNGEPLLVDTGNERVNEMLAGYVNVITGVKERIVYRVSV
jgi:predicted polyphosphate/ATP-dependent NAD kinase